MLLAVAANESAAKSRRVKRKMEQNAAAGIPHGGAQRPFGYAADKVTLIPAEAEVIGTLAERYVAGESLRALATWLDEQASRQSAANRGERRVVYPRHDAQTEGARASRSRGGRPDSLRHVPR